MKPKIGEKVFDATVPEVAGITKVTKDGKVLSTIHIKPHRVKRAPEGEDWEWEVDTADPFSVNGRSLDELFDLAKSHGEDSEPDREVGDLQDLCRAMWAVLTPEQRRLVLASPEVKNLTDQEH